MDTDKPKYMVEVYDHATGEHYEREANAEELAFYEQVKDIPNVFTNEPTE